MHRATARAIRPTQSSQMVRFAFSRCAPRHIRAIRPTQGAQRVRFAFFEDVDHAAARAIRPTQTAQRVRFAFSKRVPRRSKNDLTHPKSAGISFCVRIEFSTCAPRQSGCDATRPKRAEGSRCILKTHAAPQRERFDPPNARRIFALHSRDARGTMTVKPFPTGMAMTAREGCFFLRRVKTSGLHDRPKENAARANDCASIPSRTPQNEHPRNPNRVAFATQT